MKHVLILTALAGAFALTALPAQETPKGQEKPAQPQTIPLGSIYTTGGQQGLQRVSAAFQSVPGGPDKPIYPYSYDLKVIFHFSQGMGASNIFLARGDDITQAIKSTRRTFVGGNSADEPAQPEIWSKITSNKFWLVVYLGMGYSTPPKWLYQSATIQGKTIEFQYSRPKYSAWSADGIQYFYWLPLPELQAGVYELRLFDGDERRPTLTRWVSVS
jgi:hypothetical protein